MTPFNLHIRLFGPLELTQDGQSLLLPSSSRVRALLAYLILHHDRPIPRDRLLGIFWPERSDARARRALSNTLWQIRAALGPAAARLTSDEQVVSFALHPGDWLDVAAFRDRVEAARESLSDDGEALAGLAAAVDLYQADFLETCYDDWALLERERLRELYLWALERLVVFHKQRGEYERALDVARRLVAADPLRESAHRELMRLYHLLGRDRAALEQYATIRRLVQEELGLEPAAATVALYHEISAALEEPGLPHLPAPPLPPPALRDIGHLPFIGRDRERAVLLDAVQSAAQGRGGIALVEGEAGVGKTRLVGEVAAGARWRGMRVGIGKAVPDAAPYQPLTEALLPLLTSLRVSQLAALVRPLWLSAVAPLLPPIAALPDLPELPALEPQREQERLLEGLARCLNGLATGAPLVLIIEDLHRADEATRAALLHLAPRLRESRLLILLTCRTAEAREQAAVWETLDALDRVSPIRRVRLSSFDIAETADLVGRALGVAPEREVLSFAGRLWSETGGNPLFLVEMLKSLIEEGTLTRTESGEWRFPPSDAPLPHVASLPTIVGGRLARLSPAERAVLELVAVLCDEAEFPVLARAADDPSVLLPALEELVRRGFLVEVEAEARYCFEHGLVREIVYQAIAPQRRQTLHARVGDVLEELHPERVESLALHFYRGGVWDKAVHYRWQAGEQTTALHTWSAALNHYDRAVALADAAGLSDIQRFDLLAAREAVLNVLGRREEQAADLEAMARLARDDPQRRAEVHRRRAWFLAHTGRYDEAKEAARQALALAEREGDEAGKAAALTALGMTINWAGEPAQAVSHLRTAVQLYRRQADPNGEAKARYALGNAMLGVKKYTAAEAELEAALALHASLGNRLEEADVLSTLSILYMERGDTDTAVTRYEQALQTCRAIGYRYGEARTLANLGNVFYVQGQISRALEFYDEAVHLFQDIGDLRGETQVRINRGSVRYTFLYDEEAALADAQAALAYFREVGDPIGEGQCLSVMGQIEMARHRLEAARTHLEAGLALLLEAGERWIAVQAYRGLIFLALEENRPETALRYAEEAEAICRELGLADLTVGILALRGLALLASGQPEPALAATTEAVARLSPGVEQAYLIPFWHYQVLNAVGRTEEARAAIEQAHQLLLAFLVGLSPEQRRMSLERVPEHRAIVAAWKAVQPRRVTVRLPRADAPTGRPLRDDEYVTVTWTVAAPEDDAIGGKVARRRHRLLRLLREAADCAAAPTVPDLAMALGASTRTVERDLAALRAAGHDVRTRGARRKR